jgi:hypothetical protein
VLVSKRDKIVVVYGSHQRNVGKQKKVVNDASNNLFVYFLAIDELLAQ